MKPAPKELARISIPEDVQTVIRTAQMLGHRVSLEVPDHFLNNYLADSVKVVATGETYPDWFCPCTTPPAQNPDYMDTCKFCESDRLSEDTP